MTHIPNKRQRKEESLNSMYRLRLPARAKSTGNLCTQKAGRQSLCLLTPILIIFALIISISCSGGAETKSSLAEITELIVTINSIDYPITFDANKAATVTIPYVSTLPTEIAVKTAAISAKATGLAAGDTLKISSGQAVITITAEDGSTTAYTLNIETEPKSSQAEITELTVTINGNDYSITFDANNAATVTIPYGSTLPTEITVTSAAISAKATGLAAGDTLKISSGKANITVTAEDGTTTAHTLNVEISPLKLTNQELGDRWGLFQVVLDEEDTLYHFGVIPAGEQVPEKSEMESDLNVKKYIVGRNPINIILATTMNSPLLPFFDAVTDNASAKAIWTDTDVSFNGANIMKGDNEFAAKRSLLAPETAHKVYVLEDGGNSVHIIHEFTTAAVDLTSGSPDSPPYLSRLIE